MTVKELFIPETFDAYGDAVAVRYTFAGAKHSYKPSTNDEAGRGDALAVALAAMQDKDTLVLAPLVYETTTGFSFSQSNWTIRGNGAILKRADSSPTNRVLYAVCTSGKSFIYDLEIDGNEANVTLTTERGEGLVLEGDGAIDAYNIYAHDAPLGNDAAMNIFLDGAGPKRIINCTMDNPSYANLRIQAVISEVINCNNFVTSYKGSSSKARFVVMDGADVESCIIRGGTWKTDQTYEINANFDPGPATSLWCERVVLDGIEMDFGLNHTNVEGDSFIKFDNCRNVYMSNIRQRHSITGTPNTTLLEHFVTIGNNLKNFYMRDCITDGWVHFAGAASPEANAYVLLENCIFGYNADIKHALDNCNQGRRIIARGCTFGFNGSIKGNGNQASGLLCVIENASSDDDQTIRFYDCHFKTNWASIGYFYREVREIGHVAASNCTIENVDQGTILAPDNYQKIMAAVECGNENVALWPWSWLRASRICDIPVSQTFDHDVPQPSTPGTEAGDWWGGNITAKRGCSILNVDYGTSGNSFPREFIMNTGDAFVDD